MSDPIKKSMEAKDKTRLIPLTDWPKHRRIGRRVLLDEASFFQWVKANNPIIDEVDNV